MGNDLRIRLDNLVENPTTRVPVCLALDTSGSMSGEPIDELNRGIALFFDAVREDEVARYAADIAIVIFGEKPEKILDFADIEAQNVPELGAEGMTPMGSAINMAIDLLDQRKKEYQTVGIQYWQPWLVLMTDGQPTDDISSAVSKVTNLIENRKLCVIPVGIGDQADMKVLAAFSPTRTPLKLRGLDFRKFFLWLSSSMVKASVSNPDGTGLPLQMKDIESWAKETKSKALKGWDSL